MSVRQSSGGATAIMSTRVASLCLGVIVIIFVVLDSYETSTFVMVPSSPNPFRTCDSSDLSFYGRSQGFQPSVLSPVKF